MRQGYALTLALTLTLCVRSTLTLSQISHIRMKRDPDTGRVRGFAFVVFEHSDFADFLLSECPPDHEIFPGRMVCV